MAQQNIPVEAGSWQKSQSRSQEPDERYGHEQTYLTIHSQEEKQRMDKGLFYVGTDGRGELIKECRFEWNGNQDVAELVEYDGRHPNEEHSMSHRLEYQVQDFLEDMDETVPLFISEWWVTFDEQIFEKSHSLPDPRHPNNHGSNRYVTRVHYDPNDRFLKGALSTLKVASRDSDKLRSGLSRPDIVPVDDLPHSRLEREFIVETVFPFQFTPQERIEDPGNPWRRASEHALYVNEVLGRAIKTYS